EPGSRAVGARLVRLGRGDVSGWLPRGDQERRPRHEPGGGPPAARRLRARQGALRGPLRARQPSRVGAGAAARDRPAPRGAGARVVTAVPSTVAAPVADRTRLLAGEHPSPHDVLGAHTVSVDGVAGVVVRAFHPDAIAAEVVLADTGPVALVPDGLGGLFGG